MPSVGQDARQDWSDVVADAVGQPDRTPLPLGPPTPASRKALRTKATLVTADLAMVVAAMALALPLAASMGEADSGGAIIQQHWPAALAAIPVWGVLLVRHRLYVARFIMVRVDEVQAILAAAAQALVVLAALSFLAQLTVPRTWLVLSVTLALALLWVERELARRWFSSARRRGRLLRDVVIVGSNDEGHQLASMLLDEPGLGYRVAGFVDVQERDDGLEGSANVVTMVSRALDAVQRTEASGVIVALSAASVQVSNQLVRDLASAAIHVELSLTLPGVAADRLSVRSLGRFPIAYLEARHPVGWRAAAKRSFDVVVSGLGLLVLLPFVVPLAVLIKLDSRGPVLFGQSRVGRHGEQFKVWKFRTMVADAEELKGGLKAANEGSGPLFKMKQDPRVTRVGRLLRATSLDELPQLLNVVRGEMSLVGPRPALAEELPSWDTELYNRLRVRPGITGMWQVNGRSEASFEAYSQLDLYYVDNWSLLVDLTILFRTIPTIFRGHGAY